MIEKKGNQFQISELILVMAGLDRTFTGTLRRDEVSGRPVIFGSVKVHEGKILSMAEDEDVLGRNLDIMCLLKLDHGLHQSTGMFLEIFNSKFFLN